jgi:hypothetical protein
MRVRQTRIRFPENYLSGISDNANFYISLTDIINFENKLKKIGFNALNEGIQVLPSILGSISRFNANGGKKIRRDLPKEMVYRQAEIKDWHGNYHIVDIPYLRYPREPIPAPSCELLIRTGADNKLILLSQVLKKEPSRMALTKHLINLFLELFGECEILQEDLLPSFNVTVTRLNWDILPKGNYPWAVMKDRVDSVINSVNQQKRNIVEHRIKKISAYNPDFVAVGRAGFKGYIIMGFSDLDIYVLESIYIGNATYIFGQDWETISKLTKEQVLNKNLQKARLIHNIDWDIQIDRMLKKKEVLV